MFAFIKPLKQEEGKNEEYGREFYLLELDGDIGGLSKPGGIEPALDSGAILLKPARGGAKSLPFIDGFAS